ncbi:hypothetical protein [[Clostridium] polysaccharolyticum]|uniref:Uncharacterized protein n=1 Tax=[Clostridium] polysaccharolyticum TaxID=29364 RepID=A0A1I0EHP0_9FIRM|nr:hypothetical protein [[Clostridium] polysaccharolyticum]SET44433.1 hypothetical protein SAMN04487772_12116 [[Clostridium] polysaccharolyticum]
MKRITKKSICTILSFMLVFVAAFGVNIGFVSVKTKAASYEKAWFPMSTMNLTQLAYESYSHTNSAHIDCVGSDYAIAPFTGTVKYSSSNYGVMIFQSNDKVYYADGSLDYMTVMYMHGKCLKGVGSVVSQGTNLYEISGLGSGGAYVYAKHLDLGVYRGRASTPTSYYSQFGNTYPFNALYINKSFTTSIINKGVVASGNYVNNGGPTNYSNLWKYTTDTIDTNQINVTYQTYDVSKGAWLSNVVNGSDYAGIFGHSVSAVYASLSKGNITYAVHTRGGSWLPAVTNRSDYAGIYSKPIDGIMMKTDTGKTIHYRVHLRAGYWLPYVTGYSTSDSNNGYAGDFGKEIDAIQIYLS